MSDVDPTRDLRQRYFDALLAVHRQRGAEQIVDSPEGHCAAFADAAMAVHEYWRDSTASQHGRPHDSRYMWVSRAVAWVETADEHRKRADAAEREISDALGQLVKATGPAHRTLDSAVFEVMRLLAMAEKSNEAAERRLAGLEAERDGQADQRAELTARLAAAERRVAALHMPVVAHRHDGRWGVHCWSCSEDAGDYVYPCRVQNPDPLRWPPPVLDGDGQPPDVGSA